MAQWSAFWKSKQPKNVESANGQLKWPGRFLWRKGSPKQNINKQTSKQALTEKPHLFWDLPMPRNTFIIKNKENGRHACCIRKWHYVALIFCHLKSHLATRWDLYCKPNRHGINSQLWKSPGSPIIHIIAVGFIQGKRKRKRLQSWPWSQETSTVSALSQIYYPPTVGANCIFKLT